VFLAWLAFFGFVMLQSPGLWIAIWMTVIQYQLLNGAFLVPLHVFLCYLLAAGYRFPPAAAVTIAGPSRRAPKYACKAPGMIFN
jgi:hypothetical protein